MYRVSFVLDKNCWVYAKWLLHSSVARLASSPYPFQARMVTGRVECSNHFVHTQPFLTNAKLTLLVKNFVCFLLTSFCLNDSVVGQRSRFIRAVCVCVCSLAAYNMAVTSDFVIAVKLVNGSRVGQVGPVDPCGQVRDLDPSLVNSRNLSWVGQFGPVNSCGQVRNTDPSESK